MYSTFSRRSISATTSDPHSGRSGLAVTTLSSSTRTPAPTSTAIRPELTLVRRRRRRYAWCIARDLARAATVALRRVAFGIGLELVPQLFGQPQVALDLPVRA